MGGDVEDPEGRHDDRTRDLGTQSPGGGRDET